MRGLIIIPAFNEEKVIGQTLDDLLEIDGDWDIVVIDDGSRDQTANIAKGKGVRVVSLQFNLGIGTAVQTGYKLARREDYDWSLQYDADGQHRADQIAKMLESLEDNACIVGSRYLDDSFKNTLSRRWGARYFSLLLGVMGCGKVTDPSSGFRLCDRRATALFADNYYPNATMNPQKVKHFLHYVATTNPELKLVPKRVNNDNSNLSCWTRSVTTLSPESW